MSSVPEGRAANQPFLAIPLIPPSRYRRRTFQVPVPAQFSDRIPCLGSPFRAERPARSATLVVNRDPVAIRDFQRHRDHNPCIYSTVHHDMEAFFSTSEGAHPTYPKRGIRQAAFRCSEKVLHLVTPLRSGPGKLAVWGASRFKIFASSRCQDANRITNSNRMFAFGGLS